MSQSFAEIQAAPSALPAILGQVAARMGQGDFQGAIDMLMAAGDLVVNEPIASNTLAFLLLKADRPQEAIPWFEAALALNPEYGQAIAGLGVACQTARDFPRALQCYDRAIALLPEDAKSWYHRGLVLAELGRLPDALSSLERAITLKADYGLALTKRSHVLEALNDLPAAIAAAGRCCEMMPDAASSWSLLGDLLQKSGDLSGAIGAYDRGLMLSPTDMACLCNRAQALKLAGRTQEALIFASAALHHDPAHRQALLLSGNLHLKLNNPKAARDYFLSVARDGIAWSYPAARQPARFRATMLFSPFAGNTPYEDLIKDATFDADLLLVLPDHNYSPEQLRTGADIVVNLIAEADLGLELIEPAARLAAALGKPVVNPPAKIAGTDRQSVSARLSNIADAVMPRSVRTDAEDLRRRIGEGEIRHFPLIVRCAGMHGGEKMELVDSQQALLAFADTVAGQPLYLTEFVDYRSPDGFFRKYRFVFVGQEILPYHLAIGDQWKVHHVSTRMGEVEWMRNEERDFLDNPSSAFGPGAMAALEAIRREIGLDYFGIDCSVDSDGRVVVFEANATMLIHLHNEGFDYKTPHVLRIKAAFERMLEERVLRSRQAVNAGAWPADWAAAR